MNFDDVAFEDVPLAVTVASLAARHVAKGILVRWRTGTEAELLGFHVYRSRGHSWKRLTHSLIVAKGSVAGASYRFLDRTARRGVAHRYRIKALNRDGTVNWFGPVRATRQRLGDSESGRDADGKEEAGSVRIAEAVRMAAAE